MTRTDIHPRVTPAYGTAGNHSHDAARAAFYAVNRLPSLGDDTRPEALTEAAAHRLLNNLTPRPAAHLDAVMCAYPIGLGMAHDAWLRRTLNRTYEVEAQRGWGAIITRLPSAAGGDYVVTLERDGRSYQVDAASMDTTACGSGRRITAPATLGHLAELIDAANGQGKLARHTVGMDTLAAIGAEIAAADGKAQAASEEARKAQALRDAAPALREALASIVAYCEASGVVITPGLDAQARAALAAANGDAPEARHPVAYRIAPRPTAIAGEGALPGATVYQSADAPEAVAARIGVPLTQLQRLDAGVWVYVI